MGSLFFDIGVSDLGYHKIYHSENLIPSLRSLQGFITVLWVKLGEEYNAKGSERIGPIDPIGDEGPWAHGAMQRGASCLYCKVDIETGILLNMQEEPCAKPPDELGCDLSPLSPPRHKGWEQTMVASSDNGYSTGQKKLNPLQQIAYDHSRDL